MGRKTSFPDTFEWYRYRLQRFVVRHPQLQLGELKPFHVQRWVDSYAGLSITSRRNYLRSIKRCLEWTVKQGYIDKSPIAGLEVPAGEHREIAPNESQFQELLANVHDSNVRDLIVVTWETGCRPQESLRVEASHVDIANQRWIFRTSGSKSKRAPRIVYLTNKALELTRRRMDENPQGPLFRNSNGKPWTTEAVNCAFDRIQFRMGKAVLRSVQFVLDESEITSKIATLNPLNKSKGVECRKSDAELREEARDKLLNKKAAEKAQRYSLYALRHSWATKALKSGLDGLTVDTLRF